MSEVAGTSECVNMSNGMISDDSIRDMIRSLNSQQRQIFDGVYNWWKSTCKNKNSLTKKKVNCLNVSISEGAGVFKSYLINTIFQTLKRIFNLYSGTPENLKVLKMTPTCAAAANINGTTINSALGIPTTKRNDIPKLSDKMRCKLHVMHSELEAVIINEISMVSNISIYQTHCTLCEKFNVSLDIPIAGLTLTLLGDLYQLSPVQGKKVFATFKEKKVLHLFIMIYWIYFAHFSYFNNKMIQYLCKF